MKADTLLLRQVHPNWIKGDKLLSVAFRPFPKDENQLSVYDGDQITPEASWDHFTQNFKADGTWAVTPTETANLSLPASPLVEGYFPEHCIIDFTGHDLKAQKAKSTLLAIQAEKRGCLFKPPTQP